MSTLDDSTSLLLEMIGTDVLRSFVSIVIESFGVGRLTFIILPMLCWLTSMAQHAAIYTVLFIKATTILLYVISYVRFLTTPHVNRCALNSQKRRRRSKINATMLFIILALYIMRLTLWIIDIHNVVTELDITLLSSRSPESLDERYARMSKMQLRLGLVEDVLYAYMVRLSFPTARLF